MDVKTALLLSVSFPLAESQAEVMAVRRGLDFNELFTKEVANSPEYELTYADSLRLLVTQPNVSEGGVSVSVSDKETLIAIANSIYRKHGEPLIREQNPTVEPIED